MEMMFVGDRGVMGCCALWLIGPLIQDVCMAVSGYQCMLQFDSIKVRTVIGVCRIALSDRVECGTDRCCAVVSLKRPCVPSTAETRTSIAQNLEEGSEGARDRVVTGIQLISA